ncbi:MAG TPA: hypothetical protein VF139_09200 [Candidatus Polarisedimenticolaceae bacterium]
MTATAPRRSRWVALVAVLLLGAAFGAHRLVDPDLPQQVAVGRAILDGAAPIGVSTFVHPFPGYRYVEDKWLASVLVAAVDRAGGEHALMAYQIGLCALVAAAWMALLRRGGARPGPALVGTSIVLVANAYRLEPRPDTLSHVFLAFTLVAVGGAIPWRTLRWALPAAIGLWIHFHGYFVNGMLVAAAGLAAGLAGDRRGAIGEAGRATSLRRGALVMASAAVACLTHPQGFRALAWPVEQLALLRREPVLRGALTEFVPTTELFRGAGPATWAVLGIAVVLGFVFALRRGGSSPPVRGAVGFVLAVAWCVLPTDAARGWPYRLAIAVAVAAAVEAPSAWREGRRLEPIAFVGFSILAIPMIRNLALVPPVAAMLALPSIQGAWERLFRRREASAFVAAGVVLFVAWARLADHLPPGTYRAPGWTGWGWDAGRFPVEATAYVARARPAGTVLNNFDTSGWLLRELRPPGGVFIADNTSMYPVSFLKEYREQVMAGRVDPESLHARYGVRIAILDHAAMETPGLVARLAASSAWVLVHVDRAAAVWVREEGTTPAGRVSLDRTQAELASRVGPVRGSLPGSARRLFPELNLGIFLRAAGRPDLALREADRMWSAGAHPAIATFAAASAEEAGVLEGQVERLEQALARFGEGRSVGRWLARACFVRGVRSAAEGRLAEATRDLERSWELAPDSPGTALALASVAAEAGREATSLEYLARALALSADPAIRRAAEADPKLAPLLPRLPSR